MLEAEAGGRRVKRNKVKKELQRVSYHRRQACKFEVQEGPHRVVEIPRTPTNDTSEAKREIHSIRGGGSFEGGCPHGVHPPYRTGRPTSRWISLCRYPRVLPLYAVIRVLGLSHNADITGNRYIGVISASRSSEPRSFSPNNSQNQKFPTLSLFSNGGRQAPYLVLLY